MRFARLKFTGSVVTAACPTCFVQTWQWFWEMSPINVRAGFYQEVNAWSQLTGNRPNSVHLFVIKLLLEDQIFCRENKLPPTVPATAENMKAMFARMGAKVIQPKKPLLLAPPGKPVNG